MNDIIFSNLFHFFTLRHEKYHYTDNRIGVQEHYFAYMLRGRCRIVTDSYSVEIQEGDFFYIPNRCSYQSYWYGAPEIEFVSLGFPIFPNPEHNLYPVQVIAYDRESASLFRLLADSAPISADEIGLFFLLCGRLLPKMSHTALCRSREIVEQTRKFLEINPHASVYELAQNSAISEAALYAAFQKSASQTPNQMRNRILLEKAKEMLISTDHPIEYISELLGFSSASYFRKKFKKHFSMTPKEMRRQNRI